MSLDKIYEHNSGSSGVPESRQKGRRRVLLGTTAVLAAVALSNCGIEQRTEGASTFRPKHVWGPTDAAAVVLGVGLLLGKDRIRRLFRRK